MLHALSIQQLPHSFISLGKLAKFDVNTWNYAVVERKTTQAANSNLNEKESVNWFLCVRSKNYNDKCYLIVNVSAVGEWCLRAYVCV